MPFGWFRIGFRRFPPRTMMVAVSGYLRELGSCVLSLPRGMLSRTCQLRLALEPGCLKNLICYRQESQGWNGFHSRHSSCLCFQTSGVEAYSVPPNDQRGSCHLAFQCGTRHPWSDSLRHQPIVKLLKRTSLGSGVMALYVIPRDAPAQSAEEVRCYRTNLGRHI